MGSLFDKFTHIRKKADATDASAHQVVREGGRDWENMYESRWAHDKIVRSTHGVNCTGSCSW